VAHQLRQLSPARSEGSMIAVLLAAALLAPGHDIYPRVGMYSAMRGNGVPFLRADGSLDSAVCREQARWDVVVLDAAAPKQRPDIVRTLRAYNPRITLLGYVMGAVYWKNPHPALGDTTTDYPWRTGRPCAARTGCCGTRAESRGSLRT